MIQEPQACRVLMLGMAARSPAVGAALRDHGTAIELRTTTADDASVAAGVAERRAEAPDVIVVGPDRAQPLAAAGSLRHIVPHAQVVFVFSPARLERLRSALAFTPLLAHAWAVSEAASDAEIAAVIWGAAQPARNRRALHATFEQINTRIAASAALPDSPRRARQLAQSERFLAALLTHAPDAILAADASGLVMAWNEAAIRLFGIGRDEAIGRPMLALIPERARQAAAEVLARARRGDDISRYETPVSAAGGKEIDAELTVSAIAAEDEGDISLSILVRDMTEQKRAADAQRQSEEQFHTLADSIPQLAWMARGDGWIYWYNRRWYEYTGTTAAAMAGWGWQAVHDPAQLPAVIERWRASIASGLPFEMTFPLRGADGVFRPFLTRVMPLRDSEGAVVRWIGTNTDISEQRRTADMLERVNELLEQQVSAEVARRVAAEEALRQSQKMEALGQLSGGIAHDYNNILHVIRNAMELLDHKLLAADAETLRLLDMVRRSAIRAATLTQRLLAFSRRQPLEIKPVDPNRLVTGMAELIRHAIGESIAFETVLGGGVWTALTDANQLEAAILNLAVNARDAMPDGGKLTLESANVFLDEDYAGAQHDVAPGQYVMIAVSDSGHGMSTEVASRAFDPFFTTKEIGKGTGLGLSQVYGFVKQSGGHVKIYSEPGLGTTVKLYLPRAALAVALEPPPEAPPPLPAAGRPTILVVEDEPDVRAFTGAVLSNLGYRVLQAPDGPSALQVLDEAPSVDLLFTDVGLPRGMNGRQLAEEACRRRPTLKVLYTTGYARNAIVHHGRLDPNVDLIVKPFTYTALVARIRRVLASG